MTTNFIKIGTSITVAPEGIDYKLTLDKAYRLKWDDWNNEAFLNETNLPKMPQNYYASNTDTFNKKVLNSFNKSNKNTTGILLSGLKGSGKTLTAKKLALESNIPIIIVDDRFPANRLVQFFSKVKQEVCILFDEIDKNQRYWDSTDLLSFLDGIEHTSKKLVIFTCNDVSFANENLIDRCSRIRYYRKFDGLSKDEINNIVNDLLRDKNLKKETISAIENIKIKSYDNIISFITEINDNPNENILNLLKDLNIELK